MPLRLNKVVVMVGMMGSGKTAVGSALARKLDVPFRDSDVEIEAAANASIPEIFERHGEPFFRAKEAQVIGRLLDAAPSILSTGGGAYLAPHNRAAIAARGIAVWLRADVEVLWQRVRHRDTRPLLRTPDPRATLEELLLARTPDYAHAALVVDAEPGYSIDDMATRVIDVLLTRPDVLEET